MSFTSDDDDSMWEFDAPKFWDFTGETKQELPSDSWFSEKTISGPSYPPHYYPPTPKAYANRHASALSEKRLLDQSSSNSKENVPKKQKIINGPSSALSKKRPFKNDKDQQDAKSDSSKKQKIAGDVFSRLAKSNTIASACKAIKPPNMKYQAKPNHVNATAVTKKPITNKINHTATTSGTTTSRKLSSKLPGFIYKRVEKPMVIDDPFSTEINTTVEKVQESSNTNQKQSPTSSTGRISANPIKKDYIPLLTNVPSTPPHQIIPDWFGYNSPEKLTRTASPVYTLEPTKETSPSNIEEPKRETCIPPNEEPAKEAFSTTKALSSSCTKEKTKSPRIPLFKLHDPFLDDIPLREKTNSINKPIQSIDIKRQDDKHARHRKIIQDLRKRIYKKDPRHIRHERIIEDLRLRVEKAVKEATRKDTTGDISFVF